MDHLREFGGAKINGKWYFFFGGTTELVVRSAWQDSTYAPLSFEKLSYISHIGRLKGAVIRNPDGSFSPNEAFFQRTFFDPQGWGCNSCKTVADFDSIILKAQREKYNYKLDPEEIAQIKEEMAKSVRPPEPHKDTLWDYIIKYKIVLFVWVLCIALWLGKKYVF